MGVCTGAWAVHLRVNTYAYIPASSLAGQGAVRAALGPTLFRLCLLRALVSLTEGLAVLWGQ